MIQVAEYLRVLLIEDSKVDAELIVRFLRKNGYNPEYERVDTEDGIRSALRLWNYDIVLSDFSMPRLTVEEAYRCTREYEPEIPFVIVSGGITDEQIRTAMLSGCSGCVRKDRLDQLVPLLKRFISA